MTKKQRNRRRRRRFACDWEGQERALRAKKAARAASPAAKPEGKSDLSFGYNLDELGSRRELRGAGYIDGARFSPGNDALRAIQNAARKGSAHQMNKHSGPWR